MFVCVGFPPDTSVSPTTKTFCCIMTKWDSPSLCETQKNETTYLALALGSMSSTALKYSTDRLGLMRSCKTPQQVGTGLQGSGVDTISSCLVTWLLGADRNVRKGQHDGAVLTILGQGLVWEAVSAGEGWRAGIIVLNLLRNVFNILTGISNQATRLTVAGAVYLNHKIHPLQRHVFLLQYCGAL